MRIVLMGTGPFAVPAFERIRESGHDIAAVVTKPEPTVKSRKGPPPAPVRTWAADHGLTILDPASINDPQAVSQVDALNADLMVVCDYGQILKPDALATTRLGGINLHGSLLPAFRGAAPVQRALLGGDETTGVCVIHMTPKLDGGPVLASAETKILGEETSGDLEVRLSRLGVDLVLESIDLLSTWDGATEIGRPQDPSQATRAPRLAKAEGLIDWNQTAAMIDRHVRGMQPWPVAYTFLKVRDNKPAVRLSVLKVSQVSTESDDLQPGQISGEKELIVAVGDGLLRIDRVRPAGKKEMGGDEFIRGYQIKKGVRFQDG